MWSRGPVPRLSEIESFKPLHHSKVKELVLAHSVRAGYVKLTLDPVTNFDAVGTFLCKLSNAHIAHKLQD